MFSGRPDSRKGDIFTTFVPHPRPPKRGRPLRTSIFSPPHGTMRIGIITFWQSADNYGQLLQCYALQRQLTKMGHAPFLIRYTDAAATAQPPLLSRENLVKALQVYPLLRKAARLARDRRERRWTREMARRNPARGFDAFRREHLAMSADRYDSLAQLRADPPAADCYVCGSDQVWSKLPDVPDNRAYFLDFGPETTRRVAYAASFGRDVYPARLTPLLGRLLGAFQGVSVREDSGVEICRQAGRQACKVLDPTLLLSAADYGLLEPTPPAGDYFFTYTLNIRRAADIRWRELSAYARAQGLRSLSATSTGYFSARELCAGTDYVYPTIPQWLGLVRGARFVATTSFHGVVFCLLFHRNFVYLPLRGKHARSNSRVTSLLAALDLSGKACGAGESVAACLERPVDWDATDRRLKRLREQSAGFLRASLAPDAPGSVTP